MQLQLLLHLPYLIGQLYVLFSDRHHVHLVLELILELPLELLHLLIHLKVHSRIAINTFIKNVCELLTPWST